MHIAIISPYPPRITGIGQYGYHVSRLLAKSGLFTRITLLTQDAPIDGVNDAYTCINVEQAWQPGSLSAGLKVAAKIQQLQPDLVWFNFGASVFGRTPLANLSGFLSPFFVQRQGIPTVLTLHELIELTDLRALKSPGGALAPWGARLLTRLALQADVVCLTMQHYVKWMATRYNHRQYKYIPLGAYYPPERLRQSSGRELLFFTTLAPFKGLELLLQAFCRLKQEYPDLQLTIAGATHARFPEYAQALHQTYGALEGVRWLGQVSEEHVRALFSGTQIVAIPYTASTGSSSVLYQAAAWGRTIIASDLPETRALARENDLQVMFFESGNLTSLIGALKALLDDPDKRQKQIDHNFNVIQRNRLEDTCCAYLHAFNDALALHRASNRIAIPASVNSEGS